LIKIEENSNKTQKNSFFTQQEHLVMVQARKNNLNHEKRHIWMYNITNSSRHERKQVYKTVLKKN